MHPEGSCSDTRDLIGVVVALKPGKPGRDVDTAVVRIDGPRPQEHVSWRVRRNQGIFRGAQVVVRNAESRDGKTYRDGAVESASLSAAFADYEARIEEHADRIADGHRPMIERPLLVHVIGATGDGAWWDVERNAGPDANLVDVKDVRLSQPDMVAAVLRGLADRPQAQEEAILIARGGGDELYALEDEAVADAVAYAVVRVPVVLAVGHGYDELVLSRLLRQDYVCDAPVQGARVIGRRDERVDRAASLVAQHDLADVPPQLVQLPAESLPLVPDPPSMDPRIDRLLVIERHVFVQTEPVYPPSPKPEPAGPAKLIGAALILTFVLLGGLSFVANHRASNAPLPSAPPAAVTAARPGAVPEPQTAARARKARVAADRRTRHTTKKAPALSGPETSSSAPSAFTTVEGRVVLPAPPPSVSVPESPLLTGR